MKTITLHINTCYKLELLIIASLILLLSACNPEAFNYLDDAPVLPENAVVAGHPGYPKINHSETKALLDIESLRKYSEVSSMSADLLPHYTKVKELSPEVLIFRKYHPLNTIAHSSGNFFSTGPVTDWPQVFAGHWAYKGNKELLRGISTTDTWLVVNDVAGLLEGHYLVIYDAPAGSFINAEHAEITAIDSVYQRVKIKRAYKSAAANHPAGSIVAQHHIQANGKLNWTYNISSTCPEDGNGRILAECRADWIIQNYYRQLDGTPVNPDLVDGIMLDAFSYYRKKGVDADNDGSRDDGIYDGKDRWIDGMNIFYKKVRNALPDKLFVDGGPHAWSFWWTNGNQMEVWPIGFGDGNSIEEAWEAQLMKMKMYMQYSVSPLYSEGLDRNPSETHPYVNKEWKLGEKAIATNRNFRFDFVLALMAGSFYGKENHIDNPDMWYDEYSVNVSAPVNSPEFGLALPNIPENQEAIRKNRGWMGEPTGPYKRIVKQDNFSPQMNLLFNGGFESGTEHWTGTNIEAVPGGSAGKFALLAAHKQDPSIKYLPGHDEMLSPGFYTLCFSARSDAMSRMNINLFGTEKSIITSPEWNRFVLCFEQKAASGPNLAFQLNEFGDTLFLDEIYLFEGNANVLYREFEHAVVALNGTNEIIIIDLDKKHSYQRIKGSQDPVNDGSKITHITLDPMDAAILIKY